MRCCGRTCCYEADDLDETRSHYSYGYRLSIWNMWYFWFVVLFVLMSCLGGCGYYKQRQRMIRSRSNSSLGFFSSLQPRSSSRRSRGNMATVMLEPSNNLPYGNTGPPNMTPYPDLTLSPPPYSEVVSQPDLYPVNKSNLPLYPGDQIINTQSGQHPLTVCGNVSQFPQPPPYTEVAKQSPSERPLENENHFHLASSANQNALSQERIANQRESSS
ncbi:hypothetical protein ACJMK2_024092 [Sinanodonta woodiana]|uniref:WW domain binding protein VOPP1 n=1 Tax=Sinanodonta woodiana TaxID=1069815 RepID=A0ABD3T7A5_SINWO